MGMHDPELPDDLSLFVRSQIDAWVADLEVLSRDPRLRKFADFREKLFKPDPSSVGPLGRGGILGRRKGLPVLDNELSACKADDLADVVVPAMRGPG
jgi:hypothetical protein